ncbi:hypothetical protein Hanom_Chr15g01337331 [Helianthus anomalus]
MGLIFVWRGAVGWGFGCVFSFVSLGTLGRVMVWDPQNFLLSVESIAGEVGIWVGGILGNAGIRCTSHAWVVVWLLQPFLRILCGVLVFVIIISWCVRMCITLLRSLFLCECSLNSAFRCCALGFSRLGISLYPGVIRQDQIFVVLFYWFSLVVYFSRTKQRSENLWLGQKLVCVVYFGSSWISTFVHMGGGILFWVLGGIRDSKAIRVVILHKFPCHSSDVIFHSVLILYLLGNLSLFSCFVVSLKGSVTILTTSAVDYGRLGFDVPWGGTYLGGIRLEIATMVRTLFSTPKCFCIFLDIISGNQSFHLWFLFRPVSCFKIESFGFVNPFGFVGDRGTLGWNGEIRWQRYYGFTMCKKLPCVLSGRYILMCCSQRKVLLVMHRWLQGYFWNYLSGCIILQSYDRIAKIADEIISWKGYIGDSIKTWSITDSHYSDDYNWLYKARYIGHIAKQLRWKDWGLNDYIVDGMRHFERIWRSNSSCQYCYLLIWMLGAMWVYWKYDNKRQAQIFHLVFCSNNTTLKVGGIELVMIERIIKLLKSSRLLKQWIVCRNGWYKGSNIGNKKCDADGSNLFVRILIKWCWLIKNVWCNRQRCRGYVISELEWQGHNGNIVKMLKRECWGQIKISTKENRRCYAGHWSCKWWDIMWGLWKVEFIKLENARQHVGLNTHPEMGIWFELAWIRCFNSDWAFGSIFIWFWKRAWNSAKLVLKVLFSRVDWTPSMFFNDLVIMYANWDVNKWARWSGYIGRKRMEINKTHVEGGSVFWALWLKWRSKRSMGILEWRGRMVWVVAGWAQWGLWKFSRSWANIWNLIIWGDGFNNVDLEPGYINRKWMVYFLGRRFYDHGKWPDIYCLFRSCGLMKFCCVDGSFSLILRIWVYVMGLCWPEGFRFGHYFCIGWPNFLVLGKSIVDLGSMSRVYF